MKVVPVGMIAWPRNSSVGAPLWGFPFLAIAVGASTAAASKAMSASAAQIAPECRCPSIVRPSSVGGCAAGTLDGLGLPRRDDRDDPIATQTAITPARPVKIAAIAIRGMERAIAPSTISF